MIERGLHRRALIDLARILYDKMERLDPAGDPWSEFDGQQVSFYACCIEEVLLHSDLIDRAISDNDMVSRKR